MTFCALNSKEWDEAGLADYEDFSDKVTFCNQIECGDVTTGEWYYIPDEPRDDGSRVIYSGTFGNDNSPGASSYTHAEVYAPDELAMFEIAKENWEKSTEYDEDWDDEDEDDDYDWNEDDDD